MESGKKSLSTFLLILLILTPLSVANAAEVTWSPEAYPLTTDNSTDRSPCIRQFLQAADGTIWIVWASNRTGNYDIWYKNSSDGGATWSNDTQLTTYQYTDKNPSIMQTANGSIWVVWERYTWTPDYNPDIFYKTSDDGGANWSNETQLTEDPDFDLCPSITEISDGNILVVWQSDRIWVWDPIGSENVPQDDLFYKNSTNGGVTWSDDIRLTTEMIIVNETAEESTIVNDRDPSVTQTSDGKIWVVWVSNRYEYRHLFYKTSSDGGATWSNETQLTTYASHNWAPSITQTINGTIWVVWRSEREGNHDIYYKTSDNGGATWSNDMRLTTHAGFDETPSITQTADGRIWIVWTSNRAGNYDIWHKTTIVNAVHDIAITAVTPNSTTVFRGETVSIEVAVANEGNVSETFDITVYADENETVIGDEITVGNQTTTNLAPYNNATLTFNWETKFASRGNYTISAYAWPFQDETDLTDNLLTNGVIQIRRLLGDLNYDVVVDQDDWMHFLASYGSSIGEPHYNPDADLEPPPDGDGDVDDDDYLLFLAYYSGYIGDPGSSADIDDDGDVDALDFVIFVGSKWCSIGDQGYNPNADLNCDGKVDDSDFMFFLAYYHKR